MRLTMTRLEGTWIYQSLRPSTAPPSPVVPWSPPGKLDVTTDETGRVEGKLKFPAVPGLELMISGAITPAVTEPVRLPERVELTGRVTLRDGRESVNELRGYFVAGGATHVIVGTIYARNDPGGEPDGTSGPFVLLPAE
jgi:hypothetical protein